MLSFALIALFVTAGIVAFLSLAESAFNLRQAWAATEREIELANADTEDASDGGTVILNLATGSARATFVTPLAVAA